MKTALPWITYGCLLAISMASLAVNIGDVVGFMRINLYYYNPRHQAADGKCDAAFNDNWCDPYFRICVRALDSGKECNLLDKETEFLSDKSSIRFVDNDSFVIPLHHPIPKQAYMRVTAYDRDQFTSNDLIGVFSSTGIVVEPSKEQLNAGLKKTDPGGHNWNVNITAMITTACVKGQYGKDCSIACLPDKHPGMIGCHENGTAICEQGFRGQTCAKPDACFYNLCVDGAECINTDEEKRFKCICDGVEGPHCYKDYNPCTMQPCRNNGSCSVDGVKRDMYKCKCSERWTGRDCEIPESPCVIAQKKLGNADLTDLFGIKSISSLSGEVCKNGGTCVDIPDDFRFICKCAAGWKGELCEIRDWTNVIIAGSVASGIFVILLCAIVPCCVRICFHRKALNTQSDMLDRKTPLEEKEDEIKWNRVYKTNRGVFVYGHGGANLNDNPDPTLQARFYNSMLIDNSADNTHQFYEYCTVQSDQDGNVMGTFLPLNGEYEVANDEAASPAPELPVRPDTLQPLNKTVGDDPKDHSKERDSVASTRFASICSEQPLLSPRTSEFIAMSEVDGDHEQTLPKRSVKKLESTLSSWLYPSRKEIPKG